jgi:hypothetical protein
LSEGSDDLDDMINEMQTAAAEAQVAAGPLPALHAEIAKVAVW